MAAAAAETLQTEEVADRGHALQDRRSLKSQTQVAAWLNASVSCDHYTSVNAVLRSSDHAPVEAIFSLRSTQVPVLPVSVYNIRLYDLRFCDGTGNHVLTKHGAWKDYDQPLAPLAADGATDRIVRVIVPAPYELEGRTYPARRFN